MPEDIQLCAKKVNKIPCTNKAIGTCVQCKKPVCYEHSEEHEKLFSEYGTNLWCTSCWETYQEWLDSHYG